jgi:hypothetical protein
VLQNRAFAMEQEDPGRKRGMAAATADSTPADPSKPDEPVRIGVVFVHGIGQQTQSETVREFSEPIYDWVTRWHRARTGFVEIRRADLSYGNPLAGSPARYELSVPKIGVHPAQTWVLAEGFWADRVTPPSLLTMIGWGLGALPKVIGKLVRNAADEPWQRRAQIEALLKKQRASAWRHALANLGTLIDVMSQGLLLMGYLLGLVGGIVLLLVLFIPAVIPLPQLQRFVLVRILAPILTERIGDFHVYTSDPLMSLHMRNGVTSAIGWLTGPGRCGSVCVIGHSGGGLIAFDAVMNGAAGDIAAVTKLITMGSALNEASEEERDKRADILRRWPRAELRPLRYDGKSRADVHWVDIWSAYDPVALGRFGGGGTRPDDDIDATNEMNLLTDHGGYFHNDEEVISLLAQEISTPGATRDRSRFWLNGYDERVQRRWERVITLVGWRLVAMLMFGLVAFGRRDRLSDDGRRVWAVLSQLPGAEGIAGIVSGIFEALSRAAGGLADATAGLAPLALVFRAIREFLRPSGLEPLVSMLLATLFIGALFIFVYWGLTFALYEPWRRAERARSVEEELPRRTAAQHVRVWARAVAIPVLLIAFAYLVRTA